MRMKLIFLAAAAAVTMLRVSGDDSAKHPMFASPTNGQKPQGALGVGSEKSLKTFTEKEFLGHQFAMRPAQPCFPPMAM